MFARTLIIIRNILFLYHYMIPFFIRLHFKFTFTFTFLYQKLPVTFVTFVTFFFLECLLKLRPDVAPTAWRRNLFCVPT